jgi:hypothetical protein
MCTLQYYPGRSECQDSSQNTQTAKYVCISNAFNPDSLHEHVHMCVCFCAQALRAAHNRSLEMLADAEARLREEAAAKAVRDEKEQQVRHSSGTIREDHNLLINRRLTALSCSTLLHAKSPSAPVCPRQGEPGIPLAVDSLQVGLQPAT